MPYSRSSSSSGIPGGYAARRRTQSGTRSPSSIVSRVLPASREPSLAIRVSNSLMWSPSRRVESQNLHHGRKRGHAREGTAHPCLGAMASQIEEEHVLPWPAPQRARFDLVQAHPFAGERLQQLREDADLVLDRAEHRRLVVP